MLAAEAPEEVAAPIPAGLAVPVAVVKLGSGRGRPHNERRFHKMIPGAGVPVSPPVLTQTKRRDMIEEAEAIKERSGKKTDKASQDMAALAGMLAEVLRTG
jgi:hypothetical protein